VLLLLCTRLLVFIHANLCSEHRGSSTPSPLGRRTHPSPEDAEPRRSAAGEWLHRLREAEKVLLGPVPPTQQPEVPRVWPGQQDRLLRALITAFTGAWRKGLQGKAKAQTTRTLHQHRAPRLRLLSAITSARGSRSAASPCPSPKRPRQGHAVRAGSNASTRQPAGAPHRARGPSDSGTTKPLLFRLLSTAGHCHTPTSSASACDVNHRITESQNSRGWKGPLWVI